MQVLNGLLSRDNQKEGISIPIGIIPAGSDNSLIWTVLGVRDPISAAMAIVKVKNFYGQLRMFIKLFHDQIKIFVEWMIFIDISLTIPHFFFLVVSSLILAMFSSLMLYDDFFS